MSAIDLSDEQLATIEKILREHLSTQTEVWLFGSRVTGRAKPYSDIDLAIKAEQPLTLDVLARLADSFENSSLPYKVDMVDWYAIDDEFKQIIERERQKII